MMPLLRILTMVTLAAFGTAALAAQEKSDVAKSAGDTKSSRRPRSSSV